MFSNFCTFFFFGSSCHLLHQFIEMRLMGVSNCHLYQVVSISCSFKEAYQITNLPALSGRFCFNTSLDQSLAHVPEAQLDTITQHRNFVMNNQAKAKIKTSKYFMKRKNVQIEDLPTYTEKHLYLYHLYLLLICCCVYLCLIPLQILFLFYFFFYVLLLVEHFELKSTRKHTFTR